MPTISAWRRCPFPSRSTCAWGRRVRPVSGGLPAGPRRHAGRRLRRRVLDDRALSRHLALCLARRHAGDRSRRQHHHRRLHGPGVHRHPAGDAAALQLGHQLVRAGGDAGRPARALPRAEGRAARHRAAPRGAGEAMRRIPVVLVGRATRPRPSSARWTAGATRPSRSSASWPIGRAASGGRSARSTCWARSTSSPRS